jgi:two-component system chemotaxis sensor kinase CheA
MLILSKLLAENQDGNLSADEVLSADVIHKSGNNLLELINDILDSSKIEAGKLEVEKIEVNLPKAIEHIYYLFKPISIENKLSFSIIQNNAIPEVILSDALRLGQILKNLLSNSMKFTPSGGIVNLNIHFENNEIEFTVMDNGIGIAKDKQESIFGAFNQGDGSTSRNYGGTGLGLSITANLVGLLGGLIKLESEEGKGSKFIVRLPVGPLEVIEMVDLPEYKNDFVLQKSNIVHKEDINMSEVVSKVNKEYKIISEYQDRFNSKRMLIIDEDISNVFEISGKLMDLQMNIEEASTLKELEDKIATPFDVVLINFDSISNEELIKMESVFLTIKEKIIGVGRSHKITSLTNVKEILSEMLKLSN